ncbi:ABC-2 transporter permease [Oceanobacillus jeddahense]|uniref:ABC-2 transporter permease n=1 Tax=Oceanobacillus jeddahense TaxID=1462527 RepID=UPI000595E5F4|nr:ABC-2 transporter permease [Oceanobacillus jeddahense]
MSALLLTNYYLVYKSLWMYILIALGAAGIILGFGGDAMHQFIPLLTMLLIAMPALEVIKQEGKSGYDKFVITFPIRRSQVVRSHYLFYFLVILLGALLITGIFTGYSLLTEASFGETGVQIGLAVCLIFVMGSFVYPLLYLLGPEKSDGILIIAAGIALVSSFGIEKLLVSLISKQTTIVNFEYIDTNVLFISGALFIGIILFILSFFFSVAIYSRKEF